MFSLDRAKRPYADVAHLTHWQSWTRRVSSLEIYSATVQTYRSSRACDLLQTSRPKKYFHTRRRAFTLAGSKAAV